MWFEMKVETIEAKKDRRMVEDPAGFFVIFQDKPRREIVVEFYESVVKDEKKGKKVGTGKLGLVVCGTSAEAICHTIAREDLVTRFEHAAYLGRELQKAEIALRNRLEYVQDEELHLRRKK
jgi:tetrahydromethanopterin S-methyltransferase subunit A